MDIITIILDEIIDVIELLKSSKAMAAYATYLDWRGDITNLNKKDYSAACDLLWRGIEHAGFNNITCKNEFKEFAIANHFGRG